MTPRGSCSTWPAGRASSRRSVWAELLFLRFALSPDERSADGLILPSVLVTRSADPLVIAMLGHEIARRAGIESRVCVAGDHAWTAVLDSENCTLVGAAPPGALRNAGKRLPRRMRPRGLGCSCSSAWPFAPPAAQRVWRARRSGRRNAQRAERRSGLPRTPAPLVGGASGGRGAGLGRGGRGRSTARRPLRRARQPRAARASRGRAARTPR